MPQEADKKELLLGIDEFNKPAELIGKNAWSQLILNLIFLYPGTYPSMPGMGIGIQQYDYQFLDDAIESLPKIIEDQVRSYLPDIPLASAIAQKTEFEGRPILLIILTFRDNGNISSTAIAATVGTSLLDFDITW